MKKNVLGPVKKFILITCCALFLILTGSFLNHAYQTQIESHLMIGLDLLKTNAPQAVAHLQVAQKSARPEVKMLSALYLARVYHHGARGIEQNYPKAVAYYEQAAQYDVAEAQYLLALFYDAGDRVPQNQEKAKEYMRRAARTLPQAKYALGVWMERGYFGTPNMETIVRLYTEAAQQGVVNAIKSLISIYHGGFEGIPQNIEKEYYWRAELKKKAKK